MSRNQSPYLNPFDALEPRLLFANPTVIDLLALYTPGVASEQGGATVMQEVIREAVNTANLAFQNSLIPLVIRLVRVEAATANGTGDLAFDLNRLRTPNDGFFDNVQTLRNNYGADLVTLFTQGEPGVSGVGDLLDNLSNPNRDNLAYTVIGDNAFTPGDTTLAHELAHNLGAGHERGNLSDPAVGPFDYSYGHRLFVGPNPFRDIMAYAPGTPIPYFANPDVLYRGVPTGVAEGQSNSADIAKTIRNTAPIVSAYRNTVVADTTAPTASLYETTLVGNVVTFTVRYRDDSAIDQSTIDNNDVRVTLPNGGVLRASQIGTTPENAFQRLATYQVVLPADRPATSSLVFNIQANQVRDVFNNAMPAAPLVSGALGDDTAASESLPYARDFGTLANPSTRFLSESLDPIDRDDYYQFTLATRSTVSFNLAGLSTNVEGYVITDLNGNGRLDGSGEQTAFTFAPTTTGDRSMSVTLDPGSYYLMVRLPTESFASSNYSLTVRTYTDVTPPTVAFVDAPDLTATGQTQYVFAVTYTDDFELDSFMTSTWAGLQIDADFDAGGGFTAFPFTPDSALNTNVANAKTRTFYYRLLASEFSANGTNFSSLDNGLYTFSLYLDDPGPHAQDAAGNRITGPTTPLGSFRIAIPNPNPIADTVAPKAYLNELAPVVAGNSTYQFSISYTDNRGINLGSLGANDVRVTGPNGYNQLATFVSFVPASNGGSVRTANYQIPAPGGRWDATDDGTYTISIEPNSVGDATTSARFVPAGLVGTFHPSIARVTLANNALTMLGTAGLDGYRVYSDANFVYIERRLSDMYIFPISSFTKLNADLGGTGDEVIFLGGTFSGTMNVDSLLVLDAQLTIENDLNLSNLTIGGANARLEIGNRSVINRSQAAGQGLSTTLTWIANGLITSSAVVAGQTKLTAIQRSDNSILIKVGRLGDTNLDGLLNVDDYHRTDRGFLERRTRWQDGDFNGDAKVNLDDYAILDAAYLSPPPAPAAAPESQPSDLAASTDNPSNAPALTPAQLTPAPTPFQSASLITDDPEDGASLFSDPAALLA